MCEFVSWVERRGHLYFITQQKLATKRWAELDIAPDDVIGHGAIRAYHHIDEGDGIDRECYDFSSPDNFPTPIVKAIKAGQMKGIGFNPHLLSQELADRYQADFKILNDHRYWADFKTLDDRYWAEFRAINVRYWASLYALLTTTSRETK